MNTRRNSKPEPALHDFVWDDLRLFLAVVEAGSINRASHRLGVGQATVSRRLAELEAAVGQTLFVRSVTGVTLTPTGEQMVTPLKRMAEWATEVSRTVAQGDARVAGTVRVTGAPLVSATILARFAARLRELHPGIQLEVSSTVRYLDLARGEADLAIRSVQERHNDLMSITRISHVNHVYVGRKLAKRVGKNPRVDELPWLAWSPEFDHMVPNPQIRALSPNSKPVFTADNFLVMLQAAEAGVGAIVLADPIAKLLQKSDLVTLDTPLGEYGASETHLVAAASALRLPKVRAVADALGAYLRELA